MKTGAFLRFASYAMISSLVLVVSCHQLPKDPELDEPIKEDFWKEWRRRAEQAPPYSPVPEPRSHEKIKNDRAERIKEVKDAKESRLPRKTIQSLELREASVVSALKSLAKIAELNIVIDGDVEGSVTLDFQNVPWNQAFHSIMQNRSLEYEWQDSILRIISYQALEKELKVRELQKKLLQIKQEERAAEPLNMRLVKIHHMDIKKMAANMQQLLEASAKAANVSYRGSVVVDEDTNTIIMNAVADDINQMLDLVDALDRPATQVHIESKIVVTSKRNARELGVQWGGLVGGGNLFGTAGGNSQGVLGDGLTLDDKINPTTGQISNFPSSSLGELFSSGALGGGATPLPGQLVGSSGLTAGLVYQRGDLLLNMQLSALESEGQADILSSPSITTLDNQTAYIESGTEIPYQSSSDNEGTNTEFKKAVLRLEVTPHVIDDSLIRLKVFTTNDEPDRTLENKDEEPAIFTRKAETTVLLFNGQTTVIAGLLKEFRSDAESGIPWIKDIPYIGRAFQSDSRDAEMNDLLIFITPHILERRTADSFTELVVTEVETVAGQIEEKDETIEVVVPEEVLIEEDAVIDVILPENEQ